MSRAERFRKVSLAVAAGSTILYWSVHMDNQRVIAERRAVRAGTTMPLPLNGFRPTLRGVTPVARSAGQTEVADQSRPRLFVVVRDTCPGSGVVVPQWIDWIGSSPNRGYSAVVVSLEGTNQLSQIVDAFASQGVNATAFQVTQVQEFTRSSGVSVTPTLLALDRRGRVRLISGRFSQATRRALEEFLSSEENVSIH